MTQIAAIQILRAMAALMVVFSHTQYDALNEATRAGHTFTRANVLPWDAGVDLFFVISGFIMVHASNRLFATPDASSAFITRRLIRIVPLYWLVTTLMLAALVLVALMGKHPFPRWDEIASSFGFLPFSRPSDGAPRPIVSLGWTLNYEMFFYCIFAVCVRFRRAVAVASATLTLLAIVVVAALSPPSATALAFWSDPIVLEFALGMGLALGYSQGWRLDRRLAALVLAIGLGLLAMDFAGMAAVGLGAIDVNGFTRLFACGVPMALIFAGAVFARPALGAGPGVAFALRLGDASYALYLFHPFAMIATRKLYLAAHLDRALGLWPFVAITLPLCVALALLVHARIEQPVGALLQARLRQVRATRQPVSVERA